MADDRYDLLIVGAGPAGMLMSIIASTIGLSHRVVEQREGLHSEPSAHVLKTHSMEVYRRVGVAEPILARATPVELQRYIIWCESIGGLAYGRLCLDGKKGDVPRFTDISPTHSSNIPQSVLEPLLHQRAIALAAGDPVTFGTSFVDYADEEGGVVATLEDRDGNRQDVRARFLIGADGARSQVRRAAGLTMEGPPALAHFLAIHIESDMRPLLARHPGVVFFLRTPTLDGFFIMHQPVGSQVFMMRFDPDATPFEQFDEASCRAIMEEAIGVPHAFRIVALDRWAMSAQVADAYRRDRVFLVGDAGHRFPPTGGLGLNTGVEDVENLTWKLAAVIRGQGGAGLLDSYETECRPIALRNTRQSVRNYARTMEVADAIGANGTPAQFRRALEELRTTPDHARFARIQSAVDAQIEHFAFLEMEMAASPERGAFLPTDRPIATPLDEVEGFAPSFRPGAHVPHVWLRDGVSTIDVLGFDRFTLFAPVADVAAWQRAVAALPARSIAVRIEPIDADMRGGRATIGDFWNAGFGKDTPFAILVRPDGRIAWAEPVDVGDRSAALASAIATVTHRADLRKREAA
jgi:2,4-dichlorophenol 6-monooxygenase